MSSSVSITPIEQKVAAVDEKLAQRRAPTPRDYALKFACASMSSESSSNDGLNRTLTTLPAMSASGVTNPFDV